MIAQHGSKSGAYAGGGVGCLAAGMFSLSQPSCLRHNTTKAA